MRSGGLEEQLVSNAVEATTGRGNPHLTGGTVIVTAVGWDGRLPNPLGIYLLRIRHRSRK
jgi:hypothetical protein